MLNKILYYIDTHPIGKIFNLGQNKAVWKKVTELKTGIKIAIEKDGKFDWDEIISIKKVGRERVYDIEVEGTHNFVGNGIIAHNTFITGDVGIGTTAPTTALHIGTNAETHSLSTADVLISSDLELDGNLYLDGGTIANSAGTASIVLSSAPTTTANTLSASNWLIENTANVGQAALMVNQTKAGDLFTASASGTTKFIVSNGGNVSAAGVYQGTSGTNTRLQATGTGTGSTGTASIYFLNSSGSTAGRFDTSDVFGGATGGTIATASGYTIHTFTSSGTFTPNGAGDVEYLVIAGGGGGGENHGGGGGAGGFRTATGFAVTAQGYTVTVGAGGAGGNAGNVHGDNGQNSVFSSITATGGGGGGARDDISNNNPGQNGGSGGGGGGSQDAYAGNRVAGTGIAGQGYAGGTGADIQGAGGGGSSAVGVDGSGNRNGGAGTASSITGSSVSYAGGGGGSNGSTEPGSGQAGGGNGGTNTAVGGNATANSGSGGGGGGAGGAAGGTGGSGIVIIRYLTAGTSNGYGTLYLGSTNTSSSDLAEYYVSGDSSIAAGDVVSISNTKVLDDGGEEVTNQGVMRKANKPYDSKLIGIISTNPGVLMGSIDGDTGQADKRMLALSGRVPVKIDPDSEPIEVGDFLTSSEKPGLAKKATQAGYTVGKALESWNPGGAGTIEVFVNLGYHDPDLALTDSGDILLASNSADIYNVSTTNGIATKIGAFAQLIAANIKAGTIVTKEFTTDSFTALQGQIDKLIAGNIKTKLISPLADSTDVTVMIGSEATPSGKLAIQNINGDEVASIDSEGNATFSGTLYADDIKSKSLDDIQALLTKVETDQKLLAEAAAWNTSTATDSAKLDELVLSDLYVTGQAAINSLSVANSLAIGTDFVISANDSSLNSLSAPLKIQSLAMAPVELMAGLVTIDTLGNVQIAGNLNVAGRIQSSGLTLKDNRDVQGESLYVSDTTASASLLSLQDSSGLQVSSVDASGSAKFNDLTTGGLVIAGPDATVSGTIINGVITTSSTIGKAVIPAGTSEIVIKNPKVTDYTMVYVTPTSDTANNVLYVKSKQNGQFVVGFTNPISTEAEFNWWIVQVQ